MKNTSSLNRWQGIIVRYQEGGEEQLGLLTTHGQLLPIAKNNKHRLLRNCVWESVYVLGKIIPVGDKDEKVLEVIYFGSNELDYSAFDHDTTESANAS